MAKKGKKHAEEEAGEAWLLPYSDLMTLLLAVFIVLFAVSKIDQQKAVQMSESFSELMMAAGTGSGGAGAADTTTPHIEVITEEADTTHNTTNPEEAVPPSNPAKYLGQLEYDSLEKIKEELDGIFLNGNMNSTVTTSIDMRGLVISLNNAILFDSGSAEIISDHADALINIAEAIKPLDNYIRIEGHTDNIPIKGDAYPSNWELSTARASSVARLFISECGIQPEKIVAVGYGEYRPIGDNLTAEGRAENRRIDIIVLSAKYNNLESQIEP